MLKCVAASKLDTRELGFTILENLETFPPYFEKIKKERITRHAVHHRAPNKSDISPNDLHIWCTSRPWQSKCLLGDIYLENSPDDSTAGKCNRRRSLACRFTQTNWQIRSLWNLPLFKAQTAHIHTRSLTDTHSYWLKWLLHSMPK